MWMGGPVPIGYRSDARSLQPVPEEATLVRRNFERYLALGSVHRLKAELDAAGIRTPERQYRNGGHSGGAAFSRGKLYALLANPLFIGRIRHATRSIPAGIPRSWPKRSGRRSRIASQTTGRAAARRARWRGQARSLVGSSIRTAGRCGRAMPAGRAGAIATTSAPISS